MKKLFSLFAIVAASLASTGSVQAQATGVFGGYVFTTQNGLDNTSTRRAAPGTGNGSIASLGTSEATAPDLGTYNIYFQSLTLSGGEILTFKNGGGNVTATDLFYAIYPVGNRPGAPSFTAFNLGFTANSTFSDASGQSYTNPGDQKWSTPGAAVNLLTASGFGGLGSQQYTLELFFRASTSLGDRFLNNGGTNYFASFTVVPEPSTYGAAALLLGAVVWSQRRRFSVQPVA